MRQPSSAGMEQAVCEQGTKSSRVREEAGVFNPENQGRVENPASLAGGTRLPGDSTTGSRISALHTLTGVC